MAVHAPITSRRETLALLGSTPVLAIPVRTRPASFADALDQYRRARAEAEAVETALHGRGNPAAAAFEDRFSRVVDMLCDRARRLAETPAPTVSALAEKIEAVSRDGDWEDHAPLILADARRLARVA